MNAMEPIKRPRGIANNWAESAYGVAEVTPTTIIESDAVRIHVPKDMITLGRYMIDARTNGPLALTAAESPEAQRALAADLGAATILHAHESTVINLLDDDLRTVEAAVSRINDYDRESPRKYAIFAGVERLNEDVYKNISRSIGDLLLQAKPQNRSTDYIIAIGSGDKLPHQSRFANTQSLS